MQRQLLRERWPDQLPDFPTSMVTCLPGTCKLEITQTFINKVSQLLRDVGYDSYDERCQGYGVKREYDSQDDGRDLRWQWNEDGGRDFEWWMKMVGGLFRISS